MYVVKSLADAHLLGGQELGTSEWELVTQEQINAFADATGDHQFIHVDVEEATALLGGTIAHGLYTVSRVPALMYELVKFEGVGSALNYGLENVRFPSFVPVGSRMRATFTGGEAKEKGGGVLLGINFKFEVEGQDKPGCVGQILVQLQPA
jgi:acyl dehydratase